MSVVSFGEDSTSVFNVVSILCGVENQRLLEAVFKFVEWFECGLHGAWICNGAESLDFYIGWEGNRRLTVWQKTLPSPGTSKLKLCLL
jgi:hypothetical protein